MPCPAVRDKHHSTYIPTEYKNLMTEYKKNLGLDRNDALLEILLAFNAFQGSLHLSTPLPPLSSLLPPLPSPSSPPLHSHE